MSQSRPKTTIPDGMVLPPKRITPNYCAYHAARALLAADEMQDRQHEEALNRADSWMKLHDSLAEVAAVEDSDTDSSDE